MATKKLVLILISIVLISFGVGLLSLNRYGFSIYDSQGIHIDFNGIDIRDGDSSVNIGSRGIHVVDGDEQVKIGLNGVDIKDKKGNSVKIGPGFMVKVKDGNNKLFGEGVFGINTKNLIKKDVDKIKLEDIKGIRNINIETPFIDVNIIPEKREDIKIHYNGYIEASYIPKLETKKSNNTLYIVAKKDNSNSYSVYNTNLKLNIYVPIDFKENIRTTTSSGNIEISKLELNNLNIITSSGDVKIYYMDITNLSIETSSGEQEIENIKSKNSKLLASSGDIEIYNFTGDLNIITSSGKINLDYKEFHNNINITTSSGDIKVILPNNSNFKLEANTSSGDIESNFPITVTGKLKNSLLGKVGNSANSIYITTNSGDISINKK